MRPLRLRSGMFSNWRMRGGVGLSQIEDGTGMSFRSLVTDFLGGAVYVKYATVALTNAQIIALPTTGITVLASPGSGYRTKLIQASVIITIAARGKKVGAVVPAHLKRVKKGAK